MTILIEDPKQDGTSSKELLSKLATLELPGELRDRWGSRISPPTGQDENQTKHVVCSVGGSSPATGTHAICTNYTCTLHTPKHITCTLWQALSGT